MSDQWEGLLTKRTRNLIFAHFYRQYGSIEAANYEIADYEKHREEFYINCWHMNDAESYLMWKVYSDRGCAIETTFERLRISFDEFPGEIEGSIVEYLNFDRDEIPVGNIYNSVIRKSLPYRDEKEFRLLFWQYSVPNQQVLIGHEGINVKVDLKRLISKIWLSPQFSGSRAELDALIEERKIDCEIQSSAVNEQATDGYGSVRRDGLPHDAE